MTDSPKDSDLPIKEGAVRGNDALLNAVTSLARLARRELRLCAPHLEPLIFNTSGFADALSAFATGHARNRARLLIDDKNQLLRDNNRLVILVRRLADGMEIREVEENDRGARDLYIVADRAAFLLQEDVYRTEGVIARAAQEIAVLVGRFDATWDRAQPVALRTLGL